MLWDQGTVGPDKGEIVGRTVAIGAFDRSRALTPRSHSVQVIDIRTRLETDDIFVKAGRHTTSVRAGEHLDGRHAVLLIHRNPEQIETVKPLVRHRHVVKIDGIIARSERIQGDRIIGVHPTTGSLVLRRSTIVIGNIETIVTVSVIITRSSDIPLILDLRSDRRIRRRVKHPSITIRLRLEIARIVCNSMDRSRQGKGSYHQDTN